MKKIKLTDLEKFLQKIKKNKELKKDLRKSTLKLKIHKD